MRICFVGAYPPERYGVGVYTQNLIQGLRKIAPNSEITVLSRLHSGPEVSNGTRVLRVMDTRQRLFSLPLFRWILQTRPDVVHIQHEYYAFGGTANVNAALLVVLLKLCSIPLVVTMHEVLRTPKLSTRSWWKAIARHLIHKTQTFLICRCAARTIVHTDLSRTTLEREFLAKRVVVIPHGTRTDVRRLDPEQAKKALHLEGRKVILSFGSLRPGKGLEYAIESIASVRERIQQATLVLAGTVAPGTGRYLEDLWSLSHKLGLEDCVVFTGRYVAEEEVSLYFSAAEAVILPYLGQFRSGSGVLHLAASYAKPVVASDVGEAAEVLRQCTGGILVPQADSSALADALTRLLLDEPTRVKMGQSLYNHMVSLSSWESAAEQTLKIYRTLTK
jgi:glycosyltransferase involved in cell wall biosynthesis